MTREGFSGLLGVPQDWARDDEYPAVQIAQATIVADVRNDSLYVVEFRVAERCSIRSISFAGEFARYSGMLVEVLNGSRRLRAPAIAEVRDLTSVLLHELVRGWPAVPSIPIRVYFRFSSASVPVSPRVTLVVERPTRVDDGLLPGDPP